jgi:pantoate--beta-alanine ligase
LRLRVLRTVDEALSYAAEVRAAHKRLALVPTMGFLHQGHLSLVREANRRADATVLSLFVNPAQFGPNEDLGRYPRDEKGDLEKCEANHVDAVFAPAANEMYPEGHQTFVEVERLSRGHDGASRPGHFRGVATVVTKLLTLLRPQFAIFGEKDYQQLQVIRALNRDLHLGAEIVGMPTVREADGLAMSSRNAYLTPNQRQRATALWRGLQAAQRLAFRGVSEAASLKEAVRQELQAAQIREDYVELVDASSLEPIDSLAFAKQARILLAAYLGTTRLIDNIGLEG